MTRSFALRVVAALALAPVLSPLAAQETVQPLPGTTLADRLGDVMRRVAANPQDVDALTTGGALSLELGDLSGAASLYARAAKVLPNDGRVKAGMGAVLVRSERPGEALRYFQQAEATGYPIARFAADRAFAYDLVGQQARAQRDYRTALGQAPDDDETTRRYALSLGISGDKDQALALLNPLLKKTDRAAWRARAFVLAMNGDVPDAETIATTMMPGVGTGLLPFFERLPSLDATDRAFAVHFGEVRPTPERLADARLAPPVAALAPEPVALAATTHTITAPVTRDTRRRDRRERSIAPVVRTAPYQTAAVQTAPVQTAPVQTAPVQTAALKTAAGRSTAPTGTVRTPDVMTTPPRAVVARVQPAPVQIAAATPAPPVVSSYAPVPAPPPVAAPAPVAIASTPVAIAPTPVAIASTTTAPVRTAAEANLAVARTPTSSARIVTPRTVAPVTVATAMPAPVAMAVVTPTPPIAAPARSIVSGPAAPLPAAAAIPTRATNPADDAVLARIIAGLSIPASELGVGPPARPVALAAAAPVATPAAVVDEARAKTARDATAKRVAEQKIAAEAENAVDTAAAKKAAAKKVAADKKALADKKAAAEEKIAEAKAAAEAKRAERANPSRIWVQVAGGANDGDLSKAYAGVKAKAPAVFGSRAAYATPLRATNRVLVGPFKTDDAARDFVNDLAKKGVSAFPFTSDKGQDVTKLAPR